MNAITLVLFALFPLGVVAASVSHARKSVSFVFWHLFTCELMRAGSRNLTRGLYLGSFAVFNAGLALLLVEPQPPLVFWALVFALAGSLVAMIIHGQDTRQHLIIHTLATVVWFSAMNQYAIVTGAGANPVLCIIYVLVTLAVLPPIAWHARHISAGMRHKTVVVALHKTHLLFLFATIFLYALIPVGEAAF